MAIEARVSRGYTWRMIIIAAVSLVFGLWGVYDYLYAIPRKQLLSDRLELMKMSRDALETEQARGQLTPEAKQANDAVAAELTGILQREFAEAGQPGPITDPQEFRDALQAFGAQLQDSRDLQWVGRLTTIHDGLVAERRLPLTEAEYPKAYTAFTQTQAAIEELGTANPPGKYDRMTQWAFILCLPCVPYFVWLAFAARRRLYRLDDDDTLHMPEGTWARDDIAEIDMSRWMAKSIARVVHRDGTRVVLDDYKYRDLHLIIGSIASRLHPDEWDAEAKPIDHAAEEDDAAEPEATGDTGAEPEAAVARSGSRGPV